METVAFVTVVTGAIVAIAIAEIAHVLSRRLEFRNGSDESDKWETWSFKEFEFSCDCSD